MTREEYIAEFKAAHPIRDCLGDPNGRWKWQKVMDCINLNEGHRTRQSAVYHRDQAAKDSWAIYEHGRQPAKCHCGRTTTRRVIDDIGECWECASED